jgi:hypothetical protein
MGVLAEKIGDMEQGAEFTKCIKLEHFHTKTLDDEVTLVDRNSETGCCPEDSTAGPAQQSLYESAQIVCGFNDDGSIGGVTTGSNCNYRKCFVHKQNIECAEGQQLLNGCCGPKGSHKFKESCKYYDKSTSSNGIKTEWCTTYHKNYGTRGYKGTSAATDDIADGKFQPENFYAYAKCEGDAPPAGNNNPETSSAAKVVMGAAGSFAIVLAFLF